MAKIILNEDYDYSELNAHKDGDHKKMPHHKILTQKGFEHDIDYVSRGKVYHRYKRSSNDFVDVNKQGGWEHTRPQGMLDLHTKKSGKDDADLANYMAKDF